ncbi:nuclease-related domain-containing protein [Alteribacillus sp. YIM 98480]|uniref:nuclease-related domain-containing protein n=1 Tax=Alteribacillus sp. YIM 98480 TaxID=2606599 RepID=UPI00131E74F2|nr:nuclease-related domain-containing protein [Alteribacillus sp. YIM 98480]
MIIKKREKTLHLKKLEALERRMPSAHKNRSMVEETLARQMAGFKGELAINYPLSFLPQMTYYIFHHLRLFDGTRPFQLDTLLLTPYYLLILEVKIISGSITINHDFPQIIRSSEDKEEAFADPFIQIERQKLQMKQWFINNRRKTMPMEAIIVMANERTVVRHDNANSRSLEEKIIPCGGIPKCIRNMEASYKKAHYSEKELESLSNLLLRGHQELDSDILKQFQVNQLELISGVQCSACWRFSMVWKRRRWQCPYCHSRSLNDHFQALEDYSLLFSPIISNRDARKFLHLSSPDNTKRMLRKYSNRYTGKTSGRKYLLR